MVKRFVNLLLFILVDLMSDREECTMHLQLFSVEMNEQDCVAQQLLSVGSEL